MEEAKKKAKAMVTKANGQLVEFDPTKLQNSLLKSGASKSLSKLILKKVKASLFPGISTAEIYANAYDLLREQSERHAGRYKLKQAILELGTSGFPFEQFVGELLKSKGFQVEANLILQGKCVRHEVDLKGLKEAEMLLVECKYHRNRGQKSDVKVALYVKARFQDIAEKMQADSPSEMPHFQPWLVTNTRFSDDAMQYGRCAGLNLLSWDYPQADSLKDWIEHSGKYPVTCLSNLSLAEKEYLAEHKVVLAESLVHSPDWLDRMKMNAERKQAILNEVFGLIKQKPSSKLPKP